MRSDRVVIGYHAVGSRARAGARATAAIAGLSLILAACGGPSVPVDAAPFTGNT